MVSLATVTVTAVGWPTVNEALAEQPMLSVPVTVYVPVPIPVKVSVVLLPDDHEYVIG